MEYHGKLRNRARCMGVLCALAGQVIAGAADYEREVQPVFKEFCWDCHADGADKGGLELDKYQSPAERLADHHSWLAVWENLRAHMMPPAKKAQPTAAQRETVIRWIERDVFKLDPANPDPGRVTIRRLNRIEYEFTVRDLLGVEFDADDEFPADDTGYGFDTIGDVLSISPLLMEKYVTAAGQIVAKAVPLSGPRVPSLEISGEAFRNPKDPKATARWLPFERPQLLEQRAEIRHAGRHNVTVEFEVTGSMEATIHSAKLVVRANGRELAREEVSWDNRKTITLTTQAELKAGGNTLGLELIPGTAPAEGENPLRLNVRRVLVRGPLSGSQLALPPQYLRIFPEGPANEAAPDRREYARKILRRLADGAFRRPVDEPTLTRLVDMAARQGVRAGGHFEQGITHALTAILASPRFLFRAEVQPEPDNPGRVVNVDEFALASRLSYFLWSSLPDAELFELARRGELRKNLRAQVDRLLADDKAVRFTRNFIGQWLQTRDVEGINIDARRILNTRDRDAANRVFNRNVRRGMRDETELLFAHLIEENRSALELLTADYTFLNEPLAKFYGIRGVEGLKMRKVELPADGHRGGVLTHGSFLVVTSNPTRTSPVKRGLFVLENILGTPPPPAPPNVPELEETTRTAGGRLTMREALAVHREKPMCASCHERFDPLGLALENFNALGMWRDTEAGRPIETDGQLITGEKFRNARELGAVLANQRGTEFLNCLTGKLLTFAIGRGMEYYDTPTIDGIVKSAHAEGLGMRSLIHAIVESVPFQKRRGEGDRLAVR